MENITPKQLSALCKGVVREVNRRRAVDAGIYHLEVTRAGHTAELVGDGVFKIHIFFDCLEKAIPWNTLTDTFPNLSVYPDAWECICAMVNALKADKWQNPRAALNPIA